MADEQEVRSRWQHLEAEPAQRRGKAVAAGDDAIAVLLEPCLVLDGGHRACQGKPIEWIRVKLSFTRSRASMSGRWPMAKPTRRPASKRDFEKVWITSRFQIGTSGTALSPPKST